MKFVLSGVETNNKGAELMLYAILQEIERKFPDAIVYLPFARIKQGVRYVQTGLDLRITPFSRFVYKANLSKVFRRLHLSKSILTRTNIVKDADWFIDGSGFAFSDQFNIKDERVKMWEDMLYQLHSNHCKIAFLPQAFGPVEKQNTRKVLAILNKYADIIMPREPVSFNYLKQSRVVDMGKVKMFTDFTSLVDGVFPSQYKHLHNGICIIPNMKMIDKGKITFEEYVHLLISVINEGKKSGHPVYLLNHEGIKDEKLCYQCKTSIGADIEVVTGLNAIEVKGLIASAYLVITSRFHGLASALNSCVPSLATSWSHKYEELCKDYKLKDCILPLNDLSKSLEKVALMLEDSKNNEIRNHLSLQVPKIKSQTIEMWNSIWSL